MKARQNKHIFTLDAIRLFTAKPQQGNGMEKSAE